MCVKPKGYKAKKRIQFLLLPKLVRMWDVRVRMWDVSASNNNNSKAYGLVEQRTVVIVIVVLRDKWPAGIYRPCACYSML